MLTSNDHAREMSLDGDGFEDDIPYVLISCIFFYSQLAKNIG